MLVNKQWVYKYQPRKLEQYVGNVEFKAMLKHHIDTNQVPSLLLYGVPGTGKSSVMRMIHNIFGNICQTHFINGSHVTTKEAINDAILPVVNSALPIDKHYKLILIDEFDRISAQGQDSLKVTIENAMSSNVRFIFASNNFEKIDSALKSRMSKHTYKIEPPTKSDVFKHLFKIMLSEKIILNNHNFPNYEFTQLVHYISDKNITVNNIKQGISNLFSTNVEIISILNKHNINTVCNSLCELFNDVMKIVIEKYPDIRSCINVADASCTSGKFRLQKTLLNSNIFIYDIIENHIDSLSNDNIINIRKIITNANSDIDNSYPLLYQNITKINPNKLAEAIIILAEYQNKHKGLFATTQKIINLHACIIELIKLRINK